MNFELFGQPLDGRRRINHCSAEVLEGDVMKGAT